MPDYTNATIRPYLANLLLRTPNHTIAPPEAQRILRSELSFSADDLIIDRSGETHWWHRVLSVADQLRKSGVLLPDNPKHRAWSLTSPNGVAWAMKVAATLDVQLPATGTPDQTDPDVRKAVEDRAVELAEMWYESHGYATGRKGKPYDLDCVRESPHDHRHVEVKGCQEDNPATIILTAGELLHARESKVPVDLIIAAAISVEENSGKFIGKGGRIFRHIKGWRPLDADLHPTQYSYAIPSVEKNKWHTVAIHHPHH